MSSLARNRSGGPRPDITAPPLDLSGLGSRRATRAALPTSSAQSKVAMLCICPSSRWTNTSLERQ